MKPPENEMLSFIDMLDLDEEVIDRRLLPIMERKSFTTNHLFRASMLLKYKLFINEQEGIECEKHDEEFYDRFIVNLLADIREDSIEKICEITYTVLRLFPSSLINKSEHLLQQLLSDLLIVEHTTAGSSEEGNLTLILLKLKICDSILNATIKNGQKISLLFLEAHIENILDYENETIKNHFLMKTVPLLFECVLGYNILDRIWIYCQKLHGEARQMTLKVLSCLSEYYLPVADKDGRIKFESTIVLESKFWEVVLFGMSCSDATIRKMSIYLAKRSIDCLMIRKHTVNIKSRNDDLIFTWDSIKEKEYKSMWDNYFVLIESLEEKQSNIVLPSLQLFDVVKDIGSEWLKCVFIIGLKHDNTQVKQKCIEYRIKAKVHTLEQATMLLEALNDINLYDNEEVIQYNLEYMKQICTDINCFPCILKAIPLVKWSPVPLYYVSLLFKRETLTDPDELNLKMGSSQISSILCDIFKIQCNNSYIRREVQKHFVHYFVSHCKDVEAKDLASILSALQLDIFDDSVQVDEIKYDLGEKVNCYAKTEESFFNFIANTYTNLYLIVEYVRSDQCIMNKCYAEINAKLDKIRNVVSRQYSRKSECKEEFIYLTYLYGDIKHTCKINGHMNEIPFKLKFLNKQKTLMPYVLELAQEEKILQHKDMNSRMEERPFAIFFMLNKERKTLMQYILELLLEEQMLEYDDMNLCLQSCSKLFHCEMNEENDVKEMILRIHSVCVAILNSNGELHRKAFALNILRLIICNEVTDTQRCLKNGKLTDFIEITKHLETQKEANEIANGGRLQNKFYELTCEILDATLSNESVDAPAVIEILSYIDHVTDCGGYGCLKWIIKIMIKLLPALELNKIEYNITQFIHRMWKETEELKSNNQYSLCIEQFVSLITNDVLLKTSEYNDIITHYFKCIIDNGSASITPLVFLLKSIDSKDIITRDLGQVIYVLHELLLFAPVLRKDQRLMEGVIQKINNIKFDLTEEIVQLSPDKFSKKKPFVSSMVQPLAVATLLKIKDPEIFKSLVGLMMHRIDELFKNKTRYHANSQHHKILLSCIQHMLFIFLIQPKSVDLDVTGEWCMKLLAKLPHQHSVRVCLEWYITLCLKDQDLCAVIKENVKFTKIPQLSQFAILYHVLKLRSPEDFHGKGYEFVVDFLLSHTMGQLFNIRLYAQYLVLQLNPADYSSKYQLTVDLIERNFETYSQEKSLVKLQEDYYINKFNAANCLVPFCIYYFLPCLYENGYKEPEILPSIERCLRYIEENSCFPFSSNWDFYKNEWEMDYLIKSKSIRSKVDDIMESSGTIQKKYIPWKSMSDIAVYEFSKKKENPSELIVVASLVDKLPNLGGMARTSEVFGVKTYVVDSLRHLQDKQFQGLSVSAERWVDIEEVRPGQPLKDYLMRKKSEGYTIVAAEQTSNSVPLQGFKFPKKTLLLLGHEKEGVPCDLLPLMDECVEIPQQGFVRSLNVHVTAAIFVWEYTRQNVL